MRWPSFARRLTLTRASAATIDLLRGATWCEDWAHTWFGVNLVAADAPASAGEYWGTIIQSDRPRSYGPGRDFAHHLRLGWRSPLMTLSVNSEGKEA